MTMHALLALILLAAPSNATIGNDIAAGGSASSAAMSASGLCTCSVGSTMGTGDMLFEPATGADCLYDEQGATCSYRTDDSNAVNRTINAEDVWPFAAAAKTAGNTIVRGGLDSKTIGCVQATCDATDTVIVVRVINGTSTSNTLVYGTDFCTGTTCTDPASAVLDNEAMATSLAAAIEALSGVGSTASGAICSGGVADSRCVGVTADRFTSSITITDSNAHAGCTVMTMGTDGAVIVDQKIRNSASGVLGCSISGAGGFSCDGSIRSSGTLVANSAVYIGFNAAGYYKWLTGSIFVPYAWAGTSGTWGNLAQTIVCADSGDGNPSTCGGAQTIASNIVVVTCADADGCSLSLAETNYSATVAASTTLIAGTTQTGALTLADAAGVVELAGGTNWTPAAGDTLQLVYNPSALTWAEVARADVTP
jgi:hypothetical protein